MKSTPQNTIMSAFVLLASIESPNESPMKSAISVFPGAGSCVQGLQRFSLS